MSAADWIDRLEECGRKLDRAKDLARSGELEGALQQLYEAGVEQVLVEQEMEDARRAARLGGGVRGGGGDE